ncbi:MAG: hypothetical protein H6662_06970 [Ardenticatenaceae bacterium]|nr:hypothetical protein [Anaerolineales bacterium]MCB8921308.1 hypothetical protein [Ardenticatenaceae bacterium]MCB8990674.1 hypothetical protein [Ardenticatenaceae bacterium]MCB9004067.1 hypothetical protein [Ardenticatenaceae bacterium]
MFKKLFALLVMLMLAALPFWGMQVLAAPQATTRYVAPGGVDGVNDCANSSNPCGSVVYAVQQTDTGDTVMVAAGWYTETDTIRLFRDVTIEGAGLDQTIVSVETNPDIYRVFQVYGDVTAAISHLTLRNAERNGVHNLGDLTLSHVNIADNRGALGGGGIYNNGVLVVSDSIIAGNRSSDVAGGLLNFGEATIRRALFVGNKAGQSSYGGGLHNQGTLTLENVTFTLNEGDAGTAVSNGGSGTINMTNVTIARNVNTQGSPASASAISNYGSSIQVVNTIIADNGPNQQCSGDVPLTSLGFNIDGHNGCHFDQANDQTFTDPLLDTFAQVTGTPNWVSALTFFGNSPALDAGVGASCPATDARGVARPIGAGCDIGAYEFDNYQIYLPAIIAP